jgi:hypothetical protein
MWSTWLHVFYVFAVTILGIFAFVPLSKKIRFSSEAEDSRSLATLLKAFTFWFTSSCLVAFTAPKPLVIGFTLGISFLGLICLYKSVLPRMRELFSEFSPLLISWITVCVLPQMYSGYLPFSVSDIWTHSSYINRLLQAPDWRLLGVNLPGENYPFIFAPTHLVMAANGLPTQDAIATWNAFALLLPIFLGASFLFWMTQLKWIDLSEKFKVFVFLCFFFALFPIAPSVEGWAGYSTFASIWMFMAIGYVTILSLQKKVFFRDKLLIASLALLIAISHPIEIVIGLYLLGSYFFMEKYTTKRHLKAFVWITLGSFALVYFSSRMINPRAELVLYRNGNYSDFIVQLRNELQLLFPAFLILGTIFSLVILVLLRKFEPVRLFLGTIVLSLILGPLNPVAFPIFREEMGLNLAHRIFFSIPYWVIIPLGIISLIRIGNQPRDSHTNLFLIIGSWFCVIVTTSVYNIERFGLDGTLTYFRNDSESQLRLYPKLYTELQNERDRVILTSTWLGAPIPSVTNNYIVTHRPWTEGPEVGRWDSAQNVMLNPFAVDSKIKMCDWGVTDILVLDPKNLPSIVLQQNANYPWLLSGVAIDSVPKMKSEFKLISHSDGVYRFAVHCENNS